MNACMVSPYEAMFSVCSSICSKVDILYSSRHTVVCVSRSPEVHDKWVCRKAKAPFHATVVSALLPHQKQNSFFVQTLSGWAFPIPCESTIRQAIPEICAINLFFLHFSSHKLLWPTHYIMVRWFLPCDTFNR